KHANVSLHHVVPYEELESDEFNRISKIAKKIKVSLKQKPKIKVSLKKPKLKVSLKKPKLKVQLKSKLKSQLRSKQIKDAFQNTQDKKQKAKMLINELNTKIRIKETQTAIKNFVSNATILPTYHNQFNMRMFLEQSDPIASEYLTEKLKKLKNLKASVYLKVELSRDIVNAEGRLTREHKSASFPTGIPKLILNRYETHDVLSRCLDRFENDLEKAENGSDWKFERIISVMLGVIRTKSIVGSAWFELTGELENLKNRQAIVNPVNNDNKCFMWAIVCALFSVKSKKNKGRISQYRNDQINSLKWDGITFPMTLDQIPLLEKLNNISMGVFVYDADADQTRSDYVFVKEYGSPDYWSIQANGGKHINLLLMHNPDKKDESHFAWINNMSALFNYTNKHKCASFICDNCTKKLTTQQAYNNHISLGKCDGSLLVKEIFPEEDDDMIQFRNHKHKERNPVAIYMDFEAILTKILQVLPKNSDSESFTREFNKHIACGIGFMVVTELKGIDTKSFVFRGWDCMVLLFNKLKKLRYEIMERLQVNEPMVLTEQEQIEFEQSTHCHICQQAYTSINDKKNKKVRDHDHNTGVYRGSAHSNCNINYHNGRYKIPIFIHNLKGYDSHLIIKALENQFQKISCIPLNPEKYLSMTMGGFQFMDSCSHLSSSLEKLAENLKKGGMQQFKHTSNYVSTLTNDPIEHLTLMNLITQKGEYPYSYFDSFERFDETQLPPIESFTNDLTRKKCKPMEYEFAHSVWKAFKCKTLGDYHDLYLRTDVLLLADVFENYRNIALKNFQLDPTYYVSLPSYAWDAMLWMTKVNIQLLTDKQSEMFYMIEKSIRGGISLICNREATANHPLMVDTFIADEPIELDPNVEPYQHVPPPIYDPSREQSHLLYLDANNLYGWAMSQVLPLGNYKWEDPTTSSLEQILALADDAPRGMFVEIDGYTPDPLHDEQADYPFPVESLIVTDDMLSKYSTNVLMNRKRSLCKDETEEIKLIRNPVKKLIPNQFPKRRYVCHYRNLKLYVQLGFVVTKVHRIISFDQSKWLEKYISCCTELRKKGTTEFEKDFFKLMINAVFGKTMESVRNRIQFDIVTTTQQEQKNTLDKITSSKLFKDARIFNENTIGVERFHTSVTLNKPISIGFSILDLSKLHMLDFHYNTMRKTFGDRCKLLMTDTDSLFYQIFTEDLYGELNHFKDQLDCSSYPKDHPFYDSTNDRILGKFKDEAKGLSITQFCGLKA
ncbi:MAG: endonuclease domain-containing protein, partial [Gammaproteobacteria bacterium]|nr:endonuclease domain-containing protein [Gammaproteobacteria bacterium]